MTVNKAYERHYLICGITSVVFLVVAIWGNALMFPYGYYRFLRFVVCGASSYIAYLSYKERMIWRAWLFGILALLYNPIIPFHLGLAVWIFANLVTIGIYAYLLITLQIVRSRLLVSRGTVCANDGSANAHLKQADKPSTTPTATIVAVVIGAIILISLLVAIINVGTRDRKYTVKDMLEDITTHQPKMRSY